MQATARRAVAAAQGHANDAGQGKGMGTAQAADLAQQAAALLTALKAIGDATQAAWTTGNPADALANAVPYMQAFGHTVLAWVWLDVALTVLSKDASAGIAANQGRLGAGAYFYAYELPKIDAWLQVVNRREPVCANMPEDAF